MAIDEIGNRAQLGLEVLERQMRKFPGVIPIEAMGLPKNGAGAARDRVGDESATVVARAGVRRKRVALADVAAIRRNAPHLGAKARQQCSNIGIRCDSAAHVSSRTSAPSGGNT